MEMEGDGIEVLIAKGGFILPVIFDVVLLRAE
jgi:hypothetical protein